MNKHFEFNDKRASYDLEISENEIKLESYFYQENPTELGNTECIHRLNNNNFPTFLNSMRVKNVEELSSLLPNFNAENWSNLHKKLTENHSESFIWQETNWND
jgi:hypothetical protein